METWHVSLPLNRFTFLHGRQLPGSVHLTSVEETICGSSRGGSQSEQRDNSTREPDEPRSVQWSLWMESCFTLVFKTYQRLHRAYPSSWPGAGRSPLPVGPPPAGTETRWLSGAEEPLRSGCSRCTVTAGGWATWDVVLHVSTPQERRGSNDASVWWASWWVAPCWLRTAASRSHELHVNGRNTSHVQRSARQVTGCLH